MHRKVNFVDGLILSAAHFKALESWVESLLGDVAIQALGFGLFRSASDAEDFNHFDSLQLNLVRPGLIQVKIKNLKGITSGGQLIYVEDEIAQDVIASPVRRDRNNYFYIFLRQDDAVSQFTEAHFGDEPDLYLPGVEVRLDNPYHDALCIGRFYEVNGTIKLDDSFLPFGLRMDSSEWLIQMHKKITKQWRNLRDRLLKHIQSGNVNESPEKSLDLGIALFRCINACLSKIENSYQSSEAFRTEMKSLFANIRSELLLYTHMNADMQHEEAYRIRDSLSSLENLHISSPFACAGDLGLDFTDLFRSARYLEDLIADLLCVTLSDQQLMIKELSVSHDVPQHTRLDIEFAEPVDIQENDMFRLEFKGFLKTSLGHKNIKFSELKLRISGSDDAVFNTLPDQTGHILPYKQNTNTFLIFYPAKLLDAARLNRLTVFLPSPLGEDVEFYPDNIRIHLKTSIMNEPVI